MSQPQEHKINPDNVIRRLQEDLATASLKAAQYGALADQLVEEVSSLHKEIEELRSRKDG